MSTGDNAFEENRQKEFYNSGQFKRRPKFEAKESFAFSKISDINNNAQDK
jgi:hypothetical protein